MRSLPNSPYSPSTTESDLRAWLATHALDYSMSHLRGEGRQYTGWWWSVAWSDAAGLTQRECGPSDSEHGALCAITAAVRNGQAVTA